MSMRLAWDSDANSINGQCKAFLALIHDCYLNAAVDEKYFVTDEAVYGASLVLGLVSEGVDRLTALAAPTVSRTSLDDEDGEASLRQSKAA